MGMAGTKVGLKALVEVLEKLDGTFWCLLNELLWSILLIFTVCLFGLRRYL